jgi:hypothetical protein
MSYAVLFSSACSTVNYRLESEMSSKFSVQSLRLSILLFMLALRAALCRPPLRFSGV